MGAASTLAAVETLFPPWSRLTAADAPSGELSGNTINLTIAETQVQIGNRTTTAKTINSMLPGPIIRLREGQDVTLNVTNRLKESSSIHWHGVLLPPEMDGVPGVSFAGIKPGETFVYKFRIKQYGTYWYHSHSPGQEQAGVYAPLIFDPIKPDPVQYDREYVVVLSDWSFQPEAAMISRLKKRAGYFNFQQRTLRELASDLAEYGWKPTTDNYMMWARMRMEATDLADATANVYTYLMNGRTAESNWTGIFTPGERVRLRFINVGAMTFHDVRIPGLKMTVVQADGQNVQPVEVDEFRFGPAETYDVIVMPSEDRAYTIFSETLDRSGYTRGTLAPRPGMSAPIPERRPRPLRTMTDMGMVMPEGKEMPGMKVAMDKNMKAGGKMAGMEMSHDSHEGHDTGKMPAPAQHDMQKMAGMEHGGIPGSVPVRHGPDMHGSGNQTIPQVTRARLDDPGIGLGGSGRRVLVYTDLKALEPFNDTRQPQRELEIHLTGHMERFMWSLDGKKYSQAHEPVRFRLGERLRWTFVNDTMMEHTMHLHGMFMQLENGSGDFLPSKHTVLVKPAERVSVAIT
ncbi:MAG: copper resistance system multicopper oxidase, partial [Acidobacteriota bacterium]